MSNIYFHLAGRLGNQLFQFAFAHQLSLRFNKKITFFVDKYHHVLDYQWGIATQMGYCQHVIQLVRSDNRGLLLKASDGCFSRNRPLFEVLNRLMGITRSMDAFDCPAMPNKPPSLITGFYSNAASIEGSPIFLKELEDYLSRSINIKRIITDANYEILHIRGTDMKNSIYGTLNREYYLRVPRSELPQYVVTDDKCHAEFVTKHLKVSGVLTPEDVNPWEAIALMRNSKKVFVSNSTLAWWGGYLCLKNGGEAVLPKPFYKGNFSASDSLHVKGFKYMEASFD